MTCKTEGCDGGVFAKRMCKRCYARIWYRKKVAGKPKRDFAQKPCDRCAVEGQLTFANLCRDCRGVLTVAERKVWAT